MKNTIAVAIFSAVLSSDLLYCAGTASVHNCEAGLRCGAGAHR